MRYRWATTSTYSSACWAATKSVTSGGPSCLRWHQGPLTITPTWLRHWQVALSVLCTEKTFAGRLSSTPTSSLHLRARQWFWVRQWRRTVHFATDRRIQLLLLCLQCRPWLYLCLCLDALGVWQRRTLIASNTTAKLPTVQWLFFKTVILFICV